MEEELLAGGPDAATVEGVNAAVEPGFFSAYFLDMYTLYGAHAETTAVVLLIAAILGLMLIRIFADGMVKILLSTAVYIYFILSMFGTFVEDGGLTSTGLGIWYAVLFVATMVWLPASVLSFLLEGVIGGFKFSFNLAMLNPLRLINLFRKSDAELEAMEAELGGGGSGKDPKRQEATIMMTDIVGYSKMMSQDEQGTYKKLVAHNEIMRAQIVKNRGTVVKTIGDAFMVRFRAPTNAVKCAIDCQKGIKGFNKDRPADDHLQIRIGIHRGEVMHTGSDVFGEGVNIAARTEPKADPGGIAVTDVVADACKNQVPAHFVSIGRLPMKNIANPPELFKVFELEGTQAAGAGAYQASNSPSPMSGGGAPSAPSAPAGGGGGPAEERTFKI